MLIIAPMSVRAVHKTTAWPRVWRLVSPTAVTTMWLRPREHRASARR